MTTQSTTATGAAGHDLPAFETISVEALREAGSMKWTKYPGTLAAFVAEMDYGLAAPVDEAIRELLDRGLTGYLPAALEHDLKRATAAWHATEYGWQVDADDVFPVADVIRAYEFAIERFSAPGSRVVLMTPAYGPFFLVPALHDREVVEVALSRQGEEWEVDLDALDAALRDGGGLVVLCNPHNPIGKVYSPAEMRDIAEVVERHGARVFSDEIHAPIVHPGRRHTPYASVDPIAAGHTLTATSASKAFNLPGLKCAQIIASNPADRAVLDRLGMAITHGAANPGVVANTAAYTHGRPWLDSVRAHLLGNRDLLLDRLAHELPAVRAGVPEATYFGWLDVSALGLPGNPQQFFLQHAAVALSDGESFGAAGQGYVRFNFAMPRTAIPTAVAAMASAVREAA